MPRMSIYLPDDLAELLRDAEGSNPSSVIQEALRRHLRAGSGEPAWAKRPTDAAGLVADATARLVEQAADDYQGGFSDALERLDDLDLEDLTLFARGGFDLERWLTGWDPLHAPKWLSAVAKDLGSIADPIGFDETSFRRSSAFERGYADGLRAAYEAIERGTTDEEPSSPEASPPGVTD